MYALFEHLAPSDSDTAGRITPDPLSSSTLTPAPSVDISPAPPFDEIMEELEEIRAVVGDVSSSILARFSSYYNEHYTGGLSCPHYIIWRSSQYVYYMVVLTDADYNPVTHYITGTYDSITYQFYQSSYYDDYLPSLSVNTVTQSGYLDIPSSGAYGSAYVYSSIDGYLPSASVDMTSRFSVVVSFSLLFIALFCAVYVFMGRFFKHGKE